MGTITGNHSRGEDITRALNKVNIVNLSREEKVSEYPTSLNVFVLLTRFENMEIKRNNRLTHLYRGQECFLE